MSRIGKLPVDIASGVTVDLKGHDITVKGKKGTLSSKLAPEVNVEVKDNKVWVQPKGDSKRARAMWGMTRTVVRNMVEGVSNGYTVKMEVQGVGYRAAVANNLLTLFLGFSHEIKYAIPEGITIAVEKQTSIAISGFDKQKVGQVAAQIRSLRKPEPYKGKGVRYEGERVRMKEGKKK
ncbi:MAG: 50S ribosomal protein L6 [Alphaproteobacteria bacterium]|nr:50S ribosomal protein L6 [Alphaproteobacteria bacterium]